MNLDPFINSRFASMTVFNLAQILPPGIGYWLGCRVADIIAGQIQTPMVRALRANQQVVHGGTLSEAQLNLIVRETLRNKARAQYDYLHYINRPRAIQRMVQMTPAAELTFQRIRENQPTMIAIPHLSNFDLAGLYLSIRGETFQALTFAHPGAGYRFQNLLRRYTGMIATPISISALKKAMLRLREGGSVLTGIDRPIHEAAPLENRPLFFNHPANLPTGYIRLAMEAKVPVTIVSVKTLGRQRYQIDSTDPLPVPGNSRAAADILQNAERVLKIIETFIEQAPSQWGMFYPVWPEMLNKQKMPA